LAFFYVLWCFPACFGLKKNFWDGKKIKSNGDETFRIGTLRLGGGIVYIRRGSTNVGNLSGGPKSDDP
jgi:hypothetical protein